VAIGFASYNKKNRPIGRWITIGTIALRRTASFGECPLTFGTGKNFKQYLEFTQLTHQKKFGNSAIWQ
jgi:hypothetical protein